MQLNDLNSILVYIYFGVGITAEVYVFTQVKLRLDRSMISITVVYLASFLLRFPFLSSGGQGNNLSTSCAQMLIQALLYFFIFEMRRLRDKLSSDDITNHLARRKISLAILATVYSLFFASYIPIYVYLFLKHFNQDTTLSEHRSLFDTLWFARTAMQELLTVFMSL